MKARYYPNSDFLGAKMGSNPSYVWRSILEAQEVIKKGTRRRIGNGDDTMVWKDPWLPCFENENLTTTMPEDKWDEDVLNDLCNDRDKRLIKQIPIPIRSRSDSWYWILDDKGEFSVKSC
ncbi:hypothetical protein DCAR_0310373 [Daucus carota subsp. sativus]|uniref:Reverse transcriptase zinc-binding domain-containing protein n=1 Tax=Daucus carota subsp. sativus TaxID=79200 RepID=A0AAF1ASX2_DAUCS|nr:hypothetical protein DCAR_0310373 [Daucus carota subsp. sativus]